jgi:diaphanous 1
MANLSPDRKAYLLSQSRTKSPENPPPTAAITSPQPATFLSLSAGTSLGLTRLLPQLTGTSNDSTRSPSPAKHGWTKRISIASLGSWTGVTVSTDPDHLGVTRDVEDGEITPRGEVASISGLTDRSYGDVKPMERQYTGGLWGWWTGSSRPEEGSPAYFLEGLRDS